MIPANIDRQLLRVQKPARYAGGEMGSVMKQKAEVDLRFAFCFPDLYEVGMSHLGMKILYSLINREEGMWCERVFAPDTDFEAILRREGIPLYGLESFDPIREFDVIGFTLQYEMCYTTVLNMLQPGAYSRFLRPLPAGGGGRADAGDAPALPPGKKRGLDQAPVPPPGRKNTRHLRPFLV